MPLSRRELIQYALALGAARPFRLFGQNPKASLLVEVRPSATGIQWSHDNAMSPNRYLPETLGPGCAFLDFDNDGWMDLYFVNSGPCDFWKPTKPTRNALYK